MVSLRERGWQEPSASSLSGTHAGMPDFTRLVSFLGTKKGQTLDTGLIYDELPLGLLTKVLMLASPPLHQAEQDTIDEAVTMTALLQGLQRYYKLESGDAGGRNAPSR